MVEDVSTLNRTIYFVRETIGVCVVGMVRRDRGGCGAVSVYVVGVIYLCTIFGYDIILIAIHRHQSVFYLYLRLNVCPS